MSQGKVEFHATKQLLLDTVLALFETENPGAISTEQVLQKARVSTGSLYHHFEDFQDLLEQALCLEYERFTSRTIDLLIMTSEQTATQEGWDEGVAEARRMSHGPQYARIRALRVWAVAYASLSDRMRDRLASAQDRLNEKFIRFIEDSKAAGRILPDIDAHALSVLVQAYQFGGVINDIAHNKLGDKTWIDFLDRLATRTWINQDQPKKP